MDSIALGKIIELADVVNPQGRWAGRHSAICLTTKAEYTSGSPIKAVVVSSQLHYTAADCMVEMKHGKGRRHPQTGFSKRCAAICCWVVVVDEDDIVEYRNIIWGSLLRDVLDCIARAQARKKSGSSTQS